jgi:hypothetical protein
MFINYNKQSKSIARFRDIEDGKLFFDGIISRHYVYKKHSSKTLPDRESVNEIAFALMVNNYTCAKTEMRA